MTFGFFSMGFFALILHQQGFPAGARGKEPTCQCRRHKETWVRSLGQEDPPEEGMTTHSSTLAWRTPWTEEPGRLLSMGSQRVGHDWRDLARLPQHLVHLPRTSSFLSVWQTLPPHNASSCGNPFMISPHKVKPNPFPSEPMSAGTYASFWALVMESCHWFWPIFLPWGPLKAGAMFSSSLSLSV